MKKIFCLLLAFCILFSFSACRKKKNQAQETQVNNVTTVPQNAQSNTPGTIPQNTQTSTNTTPQNTQKEPPVVDKIDTDTSMVAVSVPAVTESTSHANGTVLFNRTYQHISLVLKKPDVADKIILDFLTRVDSTKQSADSIETMAKSAYKSEQNWMPYLHSVLYSPTRIDHNVLSFSGIIEEYTGGPHPNRSRVSASYDLQTGDVLTLASIMHKDASVNAIRDLVLENLAQLPASTDLYEGYEKTITQRFAGDASIDENWYFTQTGLCFDFSPYEIAPYAAGTITVEIPYSKLRTILHEDYLPLGRNTPQGTVKFTPIENVDTSNSTEFAEVVVDKDGKMLIAQTDNYVQDIRIKISNQSATYTIFAAYGLHQGDGVMIQASDATREKMEFCYKTGNQTETTPIQ